jgi:hypothetical protein
MVSFYVSGFTVFPHVIIIIIIKQSLFSLEGFKLS